jgi:hypothetical protein
MIKDIMMTRKNFNWGVLAGVFGNRMAMAADIAGHTELTQRIASLADRGGGTLELGDGVYEIDKPLRIPRSVSLVMTPNAVIRAKPGFAGDAVIIKGGGAYSAFSATSGWIRGGVIDANRQPLTRHPGGGFAPPGDRGSFYSERSLQRHPPAQRRK